MVDYTNLKIVIVFPSKNLFGSIDMFKSSSLNFLTFLLGSPQLIHKIK